MLKTDQFWQYAIEAVVSASYAKTAEERQSLLDLGRTWTQAALKSERPLSIMTAALTALPHNTELLEPNSVADGYDNDRGMS
jgi:hypothetical protein